MDPPRWLMLLMAFSAIVLFACAGLVLVPFAVDLLGLTLASLFLAAGISSAAIAVILTRSVEIGGGRVVIGGIGGRAFELSELTPPLASGVFGVRIGHHDARRRVFAQVPALATMIQVRLPEFAPQLRPAAGFPIVVPGKIGSPVAYSVVAAVGALLGAMGVLLGLDGGGSGEPPVAVSLGLGSALLVGGVIVLWLTLFRVERRVEIHADRVVRVHLVGKRTDPLTGPVAASVVTESRALPRSRLEREVHRIRLIATTGGPHEVSPALVSFPDYGSAGEAALARRRVSRFVELQAIDAPVSTLYRTSRNEMAAWDHPVLGERAGVRTLIFRRAVGGRHAVVAHGGVVSINDFHNEFAVVFGDRTVVVVRPDDERPVRWLELDQRVLRLDAGFRRIVVGFDDGPQRTETFAAVNSSERTGWMRLDVVVGGVLGAPWLAAAEAVAAEVSTRGDEESWSLFAAGAIDPLLARIRAADPSDSLIPPLSGLSVTLAGSELERES